MPKRKKAGYLHGYSKKEQNRLYKQAEFLESDVYECIDLKKVKNLIEVGCGVGAQTRLLLKRYPKMKITGVDLSEQQLEQAANHLKKFVQKKQVRLSQQNAEKLSFEDSQFDGAFLCWFLEHVPHQEKVLREVRRVIKPGGVIYCSEVQNASLFVEPYSPAILKYWFIFNDEQWLMGGDPFVGAKLGNLLQSSGYKKIQTVIRPTFLDARNKKARNEFLKYWIDLMLSAAPQLIKSKRVTPTLIKQVKKEISILKKSKDSVFFFAWIQAKAQR